jgi:DNA-binding transcriptional LysR family regulator
MFTRLFADSGLSLDRLRSLLEVGAAGSIVKAAEGDPVRQSQYSRQIKELEDFFQTRLVERHGKGIRLTSNGKALGRISRFFLLGLSNFQRGCLAEEQMFRIGASATFIEKFLLPVLADPHRPRSGMRDAVETASNDEIERRLHDLTLDFGIMTKAAVSRPLQLRELGGWGVNLWVPKALHKSESRAAQAFKDKRLPLVLPEREFDVSQIPLLKDFRASLVCNSFLEARAVLEGQGLAAFLPDFLVPRGHSNAFLRVTIPGLELPVLRYQLAWNPRLLRLNPHATRKRDLLSASLLARMQLGKKLQRG